MINQTKKDNIYWYEISINSPTGDKITTRIPVVCTKPNDGVDDDVSICSFADIDSAAYVNKAILNEKLFSSPRPTEIEEKKFFNDLRKLYVKNQIKKYDMKERLVANSKLKSDLRSMFYGIGQPLNDNVLNFNKEQMMWCARVVEKIEQINCK